jgi:hypothetical protein
MLDPTDLVRSRAITSDEWLKFNWEHIAIKTATLDPFPTVNHADKEQFTEFLRMAVQDGADKHQLHKFEKNHKGDNRMQVNEWPNHTTELSTKNFEKRQIIPEDPVATAPPVRQDGGPVAQAEGEQGGGEASDHQDVHYQDDPGQGDHKAEAAHDDGQAVSGGDQVYIDIGADDRAQAMVDKGGDAHDMFDVGPEEPDDEAGGEDDAIAQVPVAAGAGDRAQAKADEGESAKEGQAVDDDPKPTAGEEGDAHGMVGVGPEEPYDEEGGEVDPIQALLYTVGLRSMMTKQELFDPGGGGGITKSRGNRAFIPVAY